MNSIEEFSRQKIQEIRETVGEARVLLGLSGGVDSAVTAALISRAIGKRLVCIFVDHGLMRKDEPEQVRGAFQAHFDMDFIGVDAGALFFEQLRGVTDPEEKRKRIGAAFIEVFAREADKLGSIEYLAQGTIRPDVVESGTEDGTSLVKSHHNVGGLPASIGFRGLIEPLRSLYKNEVRAVGEALGLPAEIVWRQPFPGPGLGVRVVGEVTPEKVAAVRESDAILREEIDNAGLSRDIQQYFTVLTGARSVGVTNGARTYGHVMAIRAVNTDDFVTGSWARIPYDVLERVSARIVGEVPGVNRVVYDITAKPPAAIEWE